MIFFKAYESTVFIVKIRFWVKYLLTTNYYMQLPQYCYNNREDRICSGPEVSQKAPNSCFRPFSSFKSKAGYFVSGIVPQEVRI